MGTIIASVFLKMAQERERDKLFARGGFGTTLLSIWRSFAGTSSRGVEARLRISGHSMLPTLREGSEVLVRQGRRGILPGMLIAYRRGCDLIVHRVIKISRGPAGRIYLTKGDHNRVADAPVREEEVLGRVVAVEPAGKTPDDLVA